MSQFRQHLHLTLLCYNKQTDRQTDVVLSRLSVYEICLLLFCSMQTERKDEQRTKRPQTACELSDKPTSEGRFHGSLHHADKQLETLGVLGEAGGECCQGVGMTAQVLQGNPLTKVGLHEKRKTLTF